MIALWIGHILIKKVIKKIKPLDLENSWKHIQGVKLLKQSAIKNAIFFKQNNSLDINEKNLNWVLNYSALVVVLLTLKYL